MAAFEVLCFKTSPCEPWKLCNWDSTPAIAGLECAVQVRGSGLASRAGLLVAKWPETITALLVSCFNFPTTHSAFRQIPIIRENALRRHVNAEGAEVTDAKRR